jgi:hypothetical protein
MNLQVFVMDINFIRTTDAYFRMEFPPLGIAPLDDGRFLHT